MKSKLLVVWGLLYTTVLCGQVITDIGYKPDTIYVGDVVTLTYFIDSDGKQLDDMTISFQNMKNLAYDTLIPSSVENMDIEPIAMQHVKADSDMAYIDTKAMNQGRVDIKVGVFDAGIFMIPSIQAQVEGKVRLLPIKKVSIPVYMRQVDAQTPDVGDIQDIIREEKNWKDYKWLWGLIAALIVVGILIYLLQKRKPQRTPVPEVAQVPVIPAEDEALEALKKLQESQIWLHGKEKEYHSELTYIVRRYLSRRYDVAALEMTSDEVITSLDSTPLPNDVKPKLSEILQIADIVKFAKGETSGDLNERFLHDSIEMIHKTTKIDG